MPSDRNGSRAVDVALAEYSALRAEIVQRIASQNTLVGVNLAAVAGIGGIALARDGDVLLLLVLPFVASALGLYYTEHTRQLSELGEYVRVEVWDFLRSQLELRALPSWQDHWRKYRLTNRRKLHYVIPAWSGLALFVLAAAVPLLLVVEPAFDRSTSHAVIWCLGLLLTVTQAGVAIRIQINIHKQPRTPASVVVAPAETQG